MTTERDCTEDEAAAAKLAVEPILATLGEAREGIQRPDGVVAALLKSPPASTAS
jgi:hypothetical protein